MAIDHEDDVVEFHEDLRRGLMDGGYDCAPLHGKAIQESDQIERSSWIEACGGLIQENNGRVDQ
jgi:hypothetical protein